MAKVFRMAFAGGGSGGHVYPLIAVANEIKKNNPAAECIFVSTKGSIEEKLVPRAGYSLHLIPSGKLKGQGLLRSAVTLFLMPFAFCKSAWLLWKYKPAMVFSAGGYAGAPFLITAALLGFPCAILEQNRIPGLANKVMAFFCKMIFLNFPDSKEAFSSKKNLYVVGHPCREEIEKASWSSQAEKAHWQKNPFHVFIFGGSQGAMGINRLLVAALPFLQGTDIFLHHQTGAQDFENIQAAYHAAGFKQAKLDSYVYEMPQAYNAAHLVICRAGASSIAELAAASKAAVLIPLVSKDRHQEFNAEELAKHNAAACYLQPSLSGEKLAAIIKDFYNNREVLQNYAKEIHKLHHGDAAKKIAQICINSNQETFTS